MKNIRFTEDVLPHIVAVAIFLIVTLLFFKPAFFDNKVLEQHDIQMYKGTAKAIQDYRKETGREALWTNSVFSGMPAYLISVEWGNAPVSFLKKALSLGLTHPISNIFLSFVSYYIMLLAFRIRPYLAIAGAIAFGLSSYMIVGLAAGHNARIGAIAFMPLVMAGIHLSFSRNKLLGFGVTTAGLALHFRENHLQITYYLVLIVLFYGLIRLIGALREKTLADFGKTLGLLVVAVIIALGTFFGQFWAITEYAAYSIRGKSDLAGATPQQQTDDALGMGKRYAFQYSNGTLEPLTLMIPDVFGGSATSSFIEDRKSKTFKELQKIANRGEQQTLNQLYPYTTTYWGPQPNSAPYYAGAIIVFLFAIGIAFAERRYVLWLVPSSILALMLSWGSTFPAFNYFMFDHFPGYDKFRSVTFTIIIVLFAMPLLGLLGLEKLWSRKMDKQTRKRLLIAFASTGGVCLFFVLFGGWVFDFTRDGDEGLPGWFADALYNDRKDLLRSDAFRSFAFISSLFILLFFQIQKKITPYAFYSFLILMVTIDVAAVDKRYLKEESYKRKRDNTYFSLTEADQLILTDRSYFRVYNLDPRNPFSTFTDARPSYHHNSIGGYHGAKLRRYQEFVDSCFYRQIQQFIGLAQSADFNFRDLHAFNMLNIKYVAYGPQRENIILNRQANGNAWFVDSVERVNSAAEELERTCMINTKKTAVIDVSKFQIAGAPGSSAGTITLTSQTPNFLKYESNSTTVGMAVFSEIYYPRGWIATIDGQEKEILRANYILRALEVPAGKHTIEFKFQPSAYTVGNKVTAASSWIALLVLVASIVHSLRKKHEKEIASRSPDNPATARHQ